METTTPALGVIIPKNLILPADRQNEMGFAVDTVAKKLLEQAFKAVLKAELDRLNVLIPSEIERDLRFGDFVLPGTNGKTVGVIAMKDASYKSKSFLASHAYYSGYSNLDSVLVILTFEE